MTFNKSKQKQLFPNGSQQQAKFTFAVSASTSLELLDRVIGDLKTRTGADGVWLSTAEYRLIGPGGQQVDQSFLEITVVVPNSRWTEHKLRHWAADTARLIGVPQIICIKEDVYVQTGTP